MTNGQLRVRSLVGVCLVAVMAMAATLLPVAPMPVADAKVGDAANEGHVSVDSFADWSVSVDTETAEITLSQFVLGSDPALDGWQSVATFIPPSPASSFGQSVAIGPNPDRTSPLIVVGSPVAEVVHLYRLDAPSVLTEIAEIAAPAGAVRFGASVDIARSSVANGAIVVGAPGANSGQGAAYLFDNTGTQLGELTDPSADATAALGFAVQIEGDTAYVGAPGDDATEGAVYEFDVTTQTLNRVLKAPTPAPGMAYGRMLSADPARVLIGGQGLASAFLQQGANLTQIDSPTGQIIGDVALEGNLIALAATGDGDPVELLSDNGATGTFLPAGTSAASVDTREIVLAGGWLTMAVADPDPQVNVVREFIDDPAQANKFMPNLGAEQSQLGNLIDVDGSTLIAARGLASSTDALGQIVVAREVSSAWSQSGWTARQYIDLTGPVGGGVAIEGNVFVASVSDAGDPGNPHVVVYERPDESSPFALVGSMRTSAGAAPRSVAIDETGEYLALGFPSVGHVEIYEGGPASWASDTPQILLPNDSQGTGVATFGHDVDFGEGFLLIGKPGTFSLASPAAFPGIAEQWRVNATGFTYFGDRIPSNSAPGDAAGWSVEIEDDLRAVGSPGLNTVQVYRSGAGDGRLEHPTNSSGVTFWGYAMDLDDGVLVVTDWGSNTVVYDLYPSTMTVRDHFVPSDSENDAVFSTFPVATSEGAVMVGARLEDFQGRDTGAIYVSEFTPSDPASGLRPWPVVVEIDDNYAVIGNPAQSRVHVLRNDGAGWNEVQVIIGDETSFGAGLALEGDLLFIGSPDSEERGGEVFRYTRNAAGEFDFSVGVSNQFPVPDDRFGSVLDVSGPYLIVGAPVNSGTGRALIYTLDLLAEPLELTSPTANDDFGSAVAISYGVGERNAGERFAWVAAPGDSQDAGAVYGYSFDGLTWNQTEVLTGPAANARFGQSISATGRDLLISVPGDGANGRVRHTIWGPTGLRSQLQNWNPGTRFDGEIVTNGDLFAGGALDLGQINVASRNGRNASDGYQDLGVSTASNGYSIDLDGDWLIAAIDASSTEWTELAALVQISDLGAITDAPPNKTTPEFGSDYGRFGDIVASTDNTWAAVAPAQPLALASDTIHIYDTATGERTQLITEPFISQPTTDVTMQDNYLVVLDDSGATLLERAGVGDPYLPTGTTISVGGGDSIDFDGALLVIGDADLNQVWAYDFDGASFTPSPQNPLTAAAAVTQDGVGYDVAVDGGVIAASAPIVSGPTKPGYIVVWSRPDAASPFVEQPSLTGAPPTNRDLLGRSIDFDGSWLVAGAPREFEPAVTNLVPGNPGRVFVYPHLGGGSFDAPAVLDPTTEPALPGDHEQSAWGHSVALGDDLIALGAPGYRDSSRYQGAVAAYRWNSAQATWEFADFVEGANTAADPEINDMLGYAVAVTGGRQIVVSAPEEDTAGNDAGAVYQFTVELPPPPTDLPNKIFPLPTSEPSGGEPFAYFGNAIDFDRTRLVIGAPAITDRASSGGAYVYVWTGTEWLLDTYLANPNPSGTSDSFGLAVAIDGDQVAVGAPFADNGPNANAGSVWVFDLAADTTQQLLPVEQRDSQLFGIDLDFEDGILAVGARGAAIDGAGNEAPLLGEVHLFELVAPGDWDFLFSRTGRDANTQYSASVAVSDGRVAVGSLDAGDNGYVEVLEQVSPGDWQVQATFEGPSQDSQFGFGLDLDGNNLAVAAPGLGEVTMFTYTNGAWDSGAVVANVGSAGDLGQIAIDGTLLVVGDQTFSDTTSNQGRAVVYGNTAYGEWTELASLVSAEPARSDFLGSAVTVAGSEVFVGAPRDDNSNGSDAGAVYYFTVPAPPAPEEPEPDVPNKITAIAGIDTTDGEAGDVFGVSVATDGDRLVIGATETGTVEIPSIDGAGEIHIFERVNGAWEFERFIENPDPGSTPAAQFGFSVAVDGDLVVASAPAFDDATGVVWIYDLEADTVTELSAPIPVAESWFGNTVALEDGTLVVGTVGRGAYIYELDNGAWQLVTRRDGSGPDYGRIVATDGDRIAIGVPDALGGGKVDVLERTLSGDWVLETSFSGSVVDGRFGSSIDISGDNLIVASGRANTATLFFYSEGSWDEGTALEPPFLSNDGVGLVVSIDGTIATVGESEFVSGGSGRVYVFGNTGYDEWTLLSELTGEDSEVGDFFAIPAIDGDTLFVGAPLDNNNNGLDAGAVYEFAVVPPPVPTPPDEPVDPVVLAELTYSLPTSVAPGATSVTVEGAEVASIGDATATSGVVAASIGSIDLTEPPVGSSATENPLAAIELGDLGLDGLGVELLATIPLTEFPIEGGWGPVLAGTPFANLPLQTVTLADVYQLPSVQSIPLRFTDLEATPLRFTDIAAIGFGELQLADIDLDADPSTDAITEWCAVIAAQGASCSQLGIEPGSTATLGSLAVAGVDIEATPLRFTPLRFTYVEASPLRFTPLRFTDIEASPLRFTPLRFTPLRFTDVNASPLRFTPLRFTPLRFTPLRFTPLRFTPLRFTDISATPLRFTPLRFTNTPDNVADCTIVDCDTATIGDAFDAGALRDFTLDDLGDQVIDGLRFEDILDAIDQNSVDALLAVLADDSITLGALVDEFDGDLEAAIGDLTLGDLDTEAFDAVSQLLDFSVGEFLEGLPPEVLDDFTIADFLLLFLPRSAYEWDSVDLGSVTLQTIGMQAPLPASVAFMTTDGPATSDVTMSVVLPDNAVLAPNSVQVTSGSGRVDGTAVVDNQLIVEVANVSPDDPHTLQFGLLQGLRLGTSTSSVTANAGTTQLSASDSISVVEAFEPNNDTLAGATPIVSDNLYVSHIGTSDDRDFYRVTVTQPATTVSIRLANLGADLDLVVYGPRLESIIPADETSAPAAPDADFSNGGDGTLSPVPLNDLPTSFDELQVYGASYQRGTEAEQVDFLALEAGDYFVQVNGYLGSSTPEPYTLRAAVVPTVEAPCPARTFPFSGGTPGTSGSVSAATNTLVLLNRSRIEAIYGPDEAQQVIAATEDLVANANAQGSGVVASILDVDALAGVGDAYASWDASPCSTIAVNNVVSAIASEIINIRAGQNIDHVLLVGGDDIIPFGRVQDGTTIANEVSYTNTFISGENNALRSAFEGSWVLTDDPYADQAPTPVANTDRVVYVPEVSMGRLVETPAEIIGAINQFITFNGELDPQTGFSAGYDFLGDGAEETAASLEAVTSPGAVQRLINETWTAAELQAGLQAGPDAALVAAHFDHANALPAAGNLSGTTSDLFDVTDAANIDFSGSVLFSVGCHGGLSVSDVLIAPTGVVSTDWAQTFLGSGAAAFVGNTGYGYGDDTAVALSEALMADFAAGLGDYDTVGEALLYAKQNYAADLTVYGSFDEKALMEATFYGIPFYRLNNTVVPVPVPDPVTEPAETGGQAYTDVFNPVIEVSGDGTEDEVWATTDSDGETQVQVTHGYPILPRFEWEVTQQDPANENELELVARGVVLEALTTRDETEVDPATARAVYDLASNEPNTDATEVTFALAPAINTYLTPEGVRQDVSMAVGAFEATEADGTGTMRLFEEFEATVYYATDPNGDTEPPIITDVQSNAAGGALNLAVSATDASAIVRAVALVTPTPLPGEDTSWQLLELTEVGGLWQGSLPFGGDGVQWLVMVVDSNGNVGWSMSKDLAFDGSSDGGYAPVLTEPVAPAGPVLVGDTVDLAIDVFDLDGSDDTITVEWDFGDGTTCTTGSGGSCELVAPTDVEPRGTTSASYTWAEAGVYDVVVTATDDDGRMAFSTIEVQVNTESTVGGLRVRGRTIQVPLPGDILPDSTQWRVAQVAAHVGDHLTAEDMFVQYQVGRFDFTSTSVDYIDVFDERATVIGTGTVTHPEVGTIDVQYEFVVGEAVRAAQLSVWETGSDQSQDPLYRLTALLFRRRSVNVTPW